MENGRKRMSQHKFVGLDHMFSNNILFQDISLKITYYLTDGTIFAIHMERKNLHFNLMTWLQFGRP